MNNNHKDRSDEIVGVLEMSKAEADFLAQLLTQVNPSGAAFAETIRHKEIKLSLMKKVNGILEPTRAVEDGEA